MENGNSVPNAELLSKQCFVTGGGGGIGRAICELFAKQGAQVVIADMNEEHALSTLQSLPNQRSHLAIGIDVSDEDSVKMAFDAATKHFGKAPNVIVNCAGISGPYKTLQNITKQEIERVLMVNFVGTVLVMQAAVNALCEEGHGGSIVNIASMGTRACLPLRGHYAASKAAVIVYTRTAAKELGRCGIRCNTVSPALVLTPMAEAVRSLDELESICKEKTAIGRIAKAEEIANVVSFLASDRSSYVTGSDYEVSGCW